MNPKLCFLPCLCLGGAALLLAPAVPSRAFSTIGGSLDETQRDVRVFDNFADPTANDNVMPAAQFPGQTGAELSIWKGFVEWGSRLHGDGSGDPVSGNLLGNGGANFDAFWAGIATGTGMTNHNIVSALTDCGGGGTLAFTETPISDGWRIRYCDEWIWDDGPATIGTRFDIQGVMSHEYGHALGLGHSSVNSATMFPSVGGGQTGLRSIAADDVAGVKFLYGAAALTKPSIVATEASAGTLTIYGTNFDATGNEVWFRSSAPTAAGVEPIVKVTGVASTDGGTIVSLAIPASAGAGDVIVKKAGAGGETLSNAFPTDLVGTFGTPPSTTPHLTSVTPAIIEALIPGSEQTITLGGTSLQHATAVMLDGVPIDPVRYTIVSATTITLDMPQAAALGAHDLAVTDGFATDGFPVTIVTPALPRYELGSGDALNVVDRDSGLSFMVSGTVGSLHRVYASLSDIPSTNAFVSLGIGNGFTELFVGGTYVIPAAGWLAVNVPATSLSDPGVSGTVFYSQTVDLTFPVPLDTSNPQSILLVQ